MWSAKPGGFAQSFCPGSMRFLGESPVLPRIFGVTQEITVWLQLQDDHCSNFLVL